jgi:nucleoid-associated protein YgaU
MNRQVGPSIVLSVLIVCFFAVALFQHDPPRVAPDQERVVVGGAVDGSRPAPTTAPNTSSSSSIGPTTRSNASAATIVSSANRVTNRDVSGRSAEARADRAVFASSEPNFQPASVRPSPSPIASAPSLASVRTADKLEVARRPRSAFTVVEADETISDVARRVYGTTDEVESLWQANRDSLPRKDTPISSGMLLRTPRVR